MQVLGQQPMRAHLALCAQEGQRLRWGAGQGSQAEECLLGHARDIGRVRGIGLHLIRRQLGVELGVHDPVQRHPGLGLCAPVIHGPPARHSPQQALWHHAPALCQQHGAQGGAGQQGSIQAARGQGCARQGWGRVEGPPQGSPTAPTSVQGGAQAIEHIQGHCPSSSAWGPVVLGALGWGGLWVAQGQGWGWGDGQGDAGHREEAAVHIPWRPHHWVEALLQGAQRGIAQAKGWNKGLGGQSGGGCSGAGGGRGRAAAAAAARLVADGPAAAPQPDAPVSDPVGLRCQAGHGLH